MIFGVTKAIFRLKKKHWSRHACIAMQGRRDWCGGVVNAPHVFAALQVALTAQMAAMTLPGALIALEGVKSVFSESCLLMLELHPMQPLLLRTLVATLDNRTLEDVLVPAAQNLRVELQRIQGSLASPSTLFLLPDMG